MRCSQLVEVVRHLVNLRVVVILDLLEDASVLWQHKVDRSALSAETTCATDSVDVVLFLRGNLVVDDETDLLDIDTTSEQISGDENANGTLAELAHDDFTLVLLHLTVHGRHDKVLARHRLLQLFDALLRVAVDQRLVDVQVRVQVQKHLNFPLLFLHRDIVLVDTFKGEFLVLDEDLGGVLHEVLGELEDLGGQRG